MQDYEVVVPSDCVGSQTAARNASALRHLDAAHEVAIAASRGVRLVGK